MNDLSNAVPMQRINVPAANQSLHTPAPVTHGVGFGSWSQRAYVAVRYPLIQGICLWKTMRASSQTLMRRVY